MYDVSGRAVQGNAGRRRMRCCKGGGDWLLEKVKEPIMLLEGEFAIKMWGKRWRM